MPDIFNNDPSEDNRPNLDEITLNTLVGEGQKYSDPDQLAKAYASADFKIAQDRHRIAELEMELKIREDLNKNNANPSQNNNVDSNSNTEPKIITDPAAPRVDVNKVEPEKVDLSERVREELKKVTDEQKFVKNVDETASRLTDYFGSPEKANEAVKRRAAELNVGIEWLREAAATSPEAFYATMGLNTASNPSATPASTGNVNIRTNNVGKKDFKYWETIRKETPKAYYARQTQDAMFAARRELGDSFFS